MEIPGKAIVGFQLEQACEIIFDTFTLLRSGTFAQIGQQQNYFILQIDDLVQQLLDCRGAHILRDFLKYLGCLTIIVLFD